ncbi:MAG: RecB family exonuclease [Candidatus Zixiibacteriota bacterium]
MPVYSHSRLEAYQNCPLRFKYLYVEKKEKLVESVETYLGSRVHETLEKLYRDLKFTKENSLAELLEHYNSAWEKNWLDSVMVVKKDYTPEHYRKLGEKCIADYYHRYHPFDQGKTLGLEQRIFIDLDGYRIQGLIDRVVQREDGTYEIHDYKTSGHLPDQETLNRDRQLALYQLGLQNRWKDVKEVELVWHYLVFDKELRSSRSKQQLDQLKEEIIDLINEIENARKKDVFPAKETVLCDWCEFGELCPNLKHQRYVEDLPKEEFLAEDGVGLANKYIEWLERKREAEANLEKIKEVIFSYALKENLKVIRGSDHKLKIKIEQKEDVPNKEQEGREKLEELIRKIGRWDEVSQLDRYALLRKLKSQDWDEKTIEEIKKYLITKPDTGIYPSKLRPQDLK